MPIYPYRCAACGFETEVMRKISDPLLTVCPKCASDQFSKQLTAPGFQLKGTGWYATDFRNSGAKPEAKKDGKDASTGGADSASDSGGDGGKSGASETATPPVTPAPATPAASSPAA
jgi:putative FmdB family regulatory protein